MAQVDIDAALSGAGTFTSSARVAYAVGSTLPGAGTLTGSAKVSYAVGSALSGAGTFTSSAKVTRFVVGSLLGAGTVTSSAKVAYAIGSALSGAGTFSPSARVALALGSALAGASTQTANGRVVYAGTSSMAGVATQTANGRVSYAGISSMAGSASFAPSHLLTNLTSALACTGTLAGSLKYNAAAVAGLPGVATLTFNARVKYATVVALSGSSSFNALVTTYIAAILFSNSGSLTAALKLHVALRNTLFGGTFIGANINVVSHPGAPIPPPPVNAALTLSQFIDALSSSRKAAKTPPANNLTVSTSPPRRRR